jgi:hypothetical protein
MAVAFDAVSSATPTSGTTSPHTWTHTGVGSNLAVVAVVCLDEATSSTTVACTYNGVSMTLLGAIPSDGNVPGNGYLYFFGIANQASGAKTVSFTFSGTTDVCVGASVSWTGAGQAVATAFGSFQPAVLSNGTGWGSAANPALSPATNVGGNVLCAIACGASTITSQSGGSQKFLSNNGSAGLCGSLVGSTAAGVGSGGTINFTSSIASSTYAIGAVYVQPLVPPYGVGTPPLEDTSTGKSTTIGQAVARSSVW